MTRKKKTTHNSEKDQSFRLTLHIVKMLPQKWNFFLELNDQHLPPHNKLQKLFNQSNVKVNYNCLPNIKSITNAPNKILDLSSTISRRICNCINIPQCPLQQICLSNNILVQADIISVGKSSETKFCFGIFERTFKLRYTIHKKLLNQRNRKSDTELSNKFQKINPAQR